MMEVPSRILGHLAFEISKSFHYISNSSLPFGILPEQLK
jgi:hypothetical protein